MRLLLSVSSRREDSSVGRIPDTEPGMHRQSCQYSRCSQLKNYSQRPAFATILWRHPPASARAMILKLGLGVWATPALVKMSARTATPHRQGRKRKPETSVESNISPPF